MIFFDPKNPNKYSDIKRLLVPHALYHNNAELQFSRIGEGDGSYVFCRELMDEFHNVLSYGIGNDPEGVSFEQEIGKTNRVIMFDPAIKNPPVEIHNGEFYQEALTKGNFWKHVKKHGNILTGRNILKMDVEGHEYEWLNDANMEILGDYFGQFAIEVHGLIEEIPNGWGVEEQVRRAKSQKSLVKNFFKKLNSRFFLWHMHGNNHAPRYVDFPDSLELTYINKGVVSQMGDIRTKPFPVEGLDKPNYSGRPDYVLDWWL